uniref:Uncharacterized protein n=1 Tax=Physcomitrium patens TaxID=3218 RepID=A0A2K1KEK6_PHYPA|nr:hypothetical protein PHYPA_008587 [Physcomitrium patens]
MYVSAIAAHKVHLCQDLFYYFCSSILILICKLVIKLVLESVPTKSILSSPLSAK